MSKTSNLCCPSDVLFLYPVHRHHSQRESQHLTWQYSHHVQLWLLSFWSLPLSSNQTTLLFYSIVSFSFCWCFLDTDHVDQMTFFFIYSTLFALASSHLYHTPNCFEQLTPNTETYAPFPPLLPITLPFSLLPNYSRLTFIPLFSRKCLPFARSFFPPTCSLLALQVKMPSVNIVHEVPAWPHLSIRPST